MRGRRVPALTAYIKMGGATYKVTSATLTYEALHDALDAPRDPRADFVETQNALEMMRNPPRLPEPTPFERGVLDRFQDRRRRHA